MIFSLITATVGRVEEIRTLCNSLFQQTFKDFELYIVDQNEHRLVESIVNDFKNELVIHYIRNAQKGLSLNRNIALREATGMFIGFPDDDCYYAPDTLEKVYASFEKDHNALFVATSTYGIKTKQPQHTSLRDKLYKQDVLKTCISYNIFVRNNSIMFDERLGVGTYFSSGEETDYLYAQFKTKRDYGVFCKEASVYHPETFLLDSKVELNKIYRYSIGFAALQKKDWLVRHDNRAFVVYLYYLFRAFCGMLLIRNFDKHRKSFTGKIVGFVKFKV